MGRFVPISYAVSVAEKSAPAVTGAKTYYDGKQCWQYKVVFDRPGSYTWTAPNNAICARTVLVGGGGKPKCISLTADGNTNGCNSAAGAGGAYSEKIHAITGGSTAFTVVVGRQEADTTLACNSVNVHTAGGAAGCIPGAATGGDWNSRGGCVGWTCNNCGGSYSHYCGSQKCIALTACCGYCIVFQYEPSGSESTSCCGQNYAGGASAGSFLALCGGAAWGTCGSGGGGGFGGTASGGAGIGGFCDASCNWSYNCCTCVCGGSWDSYGEGMNWCTNYPGSAQGGGGTIKSGFGCRSFGSQDCSYGVWKGGDGGPGGDNQSEGQAWTFEWGWKAFCTYPFGGSCCWIGWREKSQCCGIVKHDWWDIQDMKGSGSPGTVGNRTNFMACWGGFMGPRPRNAGEGAGTGAIITTCCNPTMLGTMLINQVGVNWLKLCSLGTTGQCDQAWLMSDALFPTFITCAGTLGGSGGVNWCNYTSKAGKGGGGGQAKCQLLCVCYGGAYDCCNQTAATPLAFPPCLLDMLVSNAGTGMAIIYYREA